MEASVNLMKKLSKDPDTGMFWKCAFGKMKECAPA
jgi:hypothetical protein